MRSNCTYYKKEYEMLQDNKQICYHQEGGKEKFKHCYIAEKKKHAINIAN